MKIIRESKRIEKSYYVREFRRIDRNGCDFVFDCDSDGNVDFKNKGQLFNYQMCTSESGFVDKGVRKMFSAWTEPAVGICDGCGRKLELDGFTNTCDCGIEYNSFGQRLAPREQWGWETGEQF